MLEQIASGASNKETGRDLGISPRTVEVHRARIMDKLAAKNAADLMRIVLRAGPPARQAEKHRNLTIGRRTVRFDEAAGSGHSAGAMPPAASFARTLAQTAETLIIALAGGTAFTLLGFPAGLISGSVLAVAAAALLGRPVRVPVPLARIGYVLIGILLGAVVTPQTVKGFTAWPVSIALVMVAAVCMMLATATYLRMVHDWDRLSALLGASPGSMTQVIALSTELGADLPAIAIVQTMRVSAADHRNTSRAGAVRAGGAGASGDARTARRLVACRDRASHRGVLCDRDHPLALALSGGTIVRRHGRIGIAARLRARASGAALVDRQRFGAGARRAGRLALCQSNVPAARRLSRRRLRLIRRVGFGRHALRADRGVFLSRSRSPISSWRFRRARRTR